MAKLSATDGAIALNNGMAPRKGDWMNKLIKLSAAVFLLLSVWAIAVSAQVRVMADDVTDTRRSDGFFSKLEVKLKIFGDGLSEAKAMRLKVSKAVDETGKDLIGEKTNEDEFEEIGSSSNESSELEVELKNPARRATAVEEISGTIELFTPRKDPAATVAIANALRLTGKPLINPALKAQGIEITLWTKEQFEAQKKIEEERMKKLAESKRKEAAAEMGEEMAAGLMKIFGGLFGAMSEMDENNIALRLDDKHSKVLSIEFEDAAGKPIRRNSRSTMGDNPQTIIFGFEQKMPATAKMKVYLMTPKSVVSVLFKVTNVPLP